MKMAITVVAIVASMAMGSAVTHAQAPAGYETEPVLNAKDLATPELLQGPHFTVDPKVPVKGFLERFTIRSQYGTFEAHGLAHAAHPRERGRGHRQARRPQQDQGVRRGGGQGDRAPRHLHGQHDRPPGGDDHRLPRRRGAPLRPDQARQREVYQAATAPGQSGGERATEASKRVGMATITALGFEKERRDLAKSLGVDPYTTNPVLSEKLTDAAWVAFSGRFIIQTATSILVPYSMAMSAVTITNSTIYETPAADLVNNATVIFGETGASDAQVQALVQNPQYSLSVLTALAMGIQRLQGVPGRDAVVIFAAAAQTQDETRFVAGAINMLARYHEAVAPIAQVSAPGPILGRTAAGAPRGAHARGLHRLDRARGPLPPAAGHPGARARRVRLGPAVAPGPEGVHEAQLEDVRELHHRGREVTRP